MRPRYECVECGERVATIALPCANHICESCWERLKNSLDEDCDCSVCDGDNPACAFAPTWAI